MDFLIDGASSNLLKIAAERQFLTFEVSLTVISWAGDQTKNPGSNGSFTLYAPKIISGFRIK